MSYRLTWCITCDFCGRDYLGGDGAKYIDEAGRLEMERLYAEYGFHERADGSWQCENHPRPVAA